MGTHPIFESDFDCLTDCCDDGEHVTGEQLGQQTTEEAGKIYINAFNYYLLKSSGIR